MLPAARFERLDALRGLAIVWMVVFHFCYDLNHFHFIEQRFRSDPFWLWQRTCIVSLFLFCAGVGQSVAFQAGQSWPRFWRRWAQVACCAALVTVGSMQMFPRSYITFGVLHGIAVMLIIVRFTAPWGRWLWLLGAAALALPHLLRHPFFDPSALNWVGLYARKPITEDHVPLLPWLGVMWWGMAAGQWMQRWRPTWLSGRVNGALRPLAALGRWPLTVYMTHQPVLIGVLWLVSQARAG